MLSSLLCWHYFPFYRGKSTKSGNRHVCRHFRMAPLAKNWIHACGLSSVSLKYFLKTQTKEKRVRVACMSPVAYLLPYTFNVFLSLIELTLSPPEILQKLLMAFDPHLTTLVSRFLPEEEVDDGLSAVHLPTNTRSWGVTFSSLLDLLEILCASRLMCSTDVCSPCQRLAYRRARPLIKTAASSSCDYILKRRVLLLMKRTLLQKAGEDLALGEISAPASRDEHFGTDMGALADTVLGAVSAEWLRFVPVEMVAAASFGGPYRGPGQGGGRNRKPDHVMLRAVGLVVLKSLELTLQTGAGTIIAFIRCVLRSGLCR